MNHREPPHPPAAVRKALLCLTLVLLTAIASESLHALPPLRPLFAVASRVVEPTPYLPMVGAPPLRFQETPRPSETTVLPTTTGSAASVLSVKTASTPALSSNPSSTVSTSTPALSEPTSGTETSPTTELMPQGTKTPAPILPDELRPTVRPEDFLPYFQIPGSARHPKDVTLLVPVPNTTPAPATLPSSSATYTQSPK